MTFLLTSTGRAHYIAGIDVCMPENVPSIGEIAHSLAQINRFTGHCTRPYSVAEHSLLVADLARERYHATPAVELAALMHDAHECVCGDMASPVKWTIGAKWTAFERTHASQLRRHFGLASTFAAHHQRIKACDLTALATERRDLLPYVPGQSDPWPVLDTVDQVVQSWPHVSLTSLKREQTHWTEWRDQFLARFRTLTAQVKQDLAGRLALATVGAAAP